METKKETPKNIQIAEQLCGLAITIKERLQRAVEPEGITATQGQILMLLQDSEGCMLGTVAAALGVRASTASEAVRNLELKKLVQKKRHPIDERAISLFLTDKGREKVAALSSWPAFLENALAALPHAMQERLHVALDCLAAEIHRQDEAARKAMTAPAKEKAA